VHVDILMLSYDAYLQLYLDENGNVDVALTKREAELAESAKSNQANALSSKKATRRRRSQAQDLGLSPNLVGKLDSAQPSEATELEGWVFGTFKDCKVGETVVTDSFIFSVSNQDFNDEYFVSQLFTS
jgi:hypothetical protein